jgi:hypothetical protein
MRPTVLRSPAPRWSFLVLQSDILCHCISRLSSLTLVNLSYGASRKRSRQNKKQRIAPLLFLAGYPPPGTLPNWSYCSGVSVPAQVVVAVVL